MNIHKIMLLLLLVCVGLIQTAFGANLIQENSSFEVGQWGCDPVLDAFVRNWPDVVRPQITDETAANGKYSLKVSNTTGMDSARVIFPPVKFDAKTNLTISFYAKADRPNTTVTVSINCGWKQIQSKNFYLTDNWQRYSFSGEVMSDPRGEAGLGRDIDAQALMGVYYLQFQFISATNAPFHQAWLDAVQLEKGELTAYAPAKTFDAAINMKSHYAKQHLIYTEDENETSLLQFYSTNGASDIKGKYEVRDELTGRTITNELLSGKLDDSGHQSIELKLPPMRRGLYRINAEATTNGKTITAQRVYGVIRDLQQRRTTGKTFFGGSIELIETARGSMKPKDSTYRLSCVRIAPDVLFDLAAKMGWQWVHFYRTITPEINARTPQEREWTDSDVVTDLAIKHGLEPMSLMSSHGSMDYLPRWILSDQKGLGGTSAGKGQNLIDPEKYAAFAHDAAEHFKGRITWWENWNEPGVKMREFEYMPIMKAFYQAVKSGNPDAKVLGLCGTWDVGGDLYGWVKNCLKLGAGDYMDAIAIHGYHVNDRHYVSEVQNIARKQLGHDMPVWDTESGIKTLEPYGYQESWNTYGTITSPSAMANHLAKHLANELASGAVRQSWFNLCTSYDWLGKSEFTQLTFDGSPNASLIANNAIIDLLIDATFVKEVQAEGNTVAYLFDTPAGPVCVYWNPMFKTVCSLPMSPSSVKLLDIFGRELPINGKDKTSTLPLDENVRYLIGKKGSIKELISAIEQLEVAGLSPVKITQSQLSVGRGQPELRLMLNNVSHTPQTANITVVKQPDATTVTMNRKVELAGFAAKTLICPLTKKPDASVSDTTNNPLKIEVSDGSSNTLLSVPVNVLYSPLAKTTVPFGQQNAEIWNSTRWVAFSDWTKMKTLWNENGLYFLVQVVDDSIVNYKETQDLKCWQSDGIELYFNWNVTGDIQDTLFNANDLQLIMPVKGSGDTKDEVLKGDECYIGNKNFPLNAANIVSGRTKDGYWAQIEIKWTALQAMGLKRPEIAGFSISVRDMDKSFKERKRAIWAGDNDNYRSTEKFGLIVFEK